MNKRDLFNEIVERCVGYAINELIADNPAHDVSLRAIRSSIRSYVSFEMTRKYTLLEIQDVFEWHPRKVGREK